MQSSYESFPIFDNHHYPNTRITVTTLNDGRGPSEPPTADGSSPGTNTTTTTVLTYNRSDDDDYGGGDNNVVLIDDDDEDHADTDTFADMDDPGNPIGNAVDYCIAFDPSTMDLDLDGDTFFCHSYCDGNENAVDVVEDLFLCYGLVGSHNPTHNKRPQSPQQIEEDNSMVDDDDGM
mmetsp:Transcript_484/g.550  ORF Transcript_484/g.550 Transcript_484/m.550 type:complete len:177 (-) Transcript_484:37-567(-)